VPEAEAMSQRRCALLAAAALALAAPSGAAADPPALLHPAPVHPARVRPARVHSAPFHSAPVAPEPLHPAPVAPAPVAPAPVAPPAQEAGSGVPEGYLGDAASPDDANLAIALPPPPAAGSAALALDQDVNRRDLALRGSPRWRLAGMDANLSFPWAAGVFACSLDAPITQIATPRLYQMLRRAMADAGAAARAAKQKYNRPRPFLINKQSTCTPGAEETLAAESSYPSAHAAIGWAWALILSELAPQRSAALLARGRAFGDSRLVCNAHCDSDVIEARMVGAATVARLHADAEFAADLAAARLEIAAIGDEQRAPQRDCKFEAQAMAGRPPQAP
jgi:acid phosphatase (class A)